MGLTGLQIFKYTPAGQKTEHSNCKECACPTCMAFSLKLAKEQINIEKCPYLSTELINLYNKETKPPQKTISIGDLKIGGENVLYRHEKKFVNKTILGVVIDCAKPNYMDKINEICDYGVNILNEINKIDLIILKNTDENFDYIPIKTIKYEEFKKLDLDIIIEKDFNTTKNALINIRKKAILDKDDNYSNPVCVILGENSAEQMCANASYYLCKYANMILFPDFDKDIFSTLMSLRQNIYTDPEKTLQVEPGLYTFNKPNENSIIFLTTNFALTYFAVANELEGIDTPSYLIVIPAQGMSVLTAWSAETFTSEVVAKSLKDLDIRNKIKTRSIIIPGLLSDIVNELKESCPDFNFIKGTREASAIPDFVKELQSI